ncbi:MAG: IS200/IS605 family element transposase accessory protein TnpB [Okeania sp. SIO1H4]|uniref:Transposase n=1 Tax=Okeania hirsuta TaxID=1458930 RepID=A0A3N6PFR2_9CYAN|nr:IS200/IS605 family element transposase accessory protein TnpB [Okeania sp. SIO1H4]NES91253.1 IS200/IS605 family element transposase accessory protein TnpB [Okeania sp. SIO2B9]NET21754.1 IS200/IS605 family element transposase accessory protein TnpB [Okeania sp. SIO1H5]NET78440.1 IS200/IS605 family element transposase accessory protein TnpB [Okeania sp. SIO1F9]NET96728.1 IS200/IS605 family element transposase accessory protein TnpB [Okeania sp. SIO1H2]RQH24866.1 transposase [Okeania hirsuta]
MKLIEKHIIKPNHCNYKEIDKLCFLSKNLFNAVNYIVRQEFIFNQKYLNSAQTYHLIKESVDYKAIPRKVSCQIIRLVDRCWSSFFASLKDYSENPHKYLGKPNLPRYKDKLKGRCVTIYPAQAISKRGLKKGFLEPSGTNISIPTKIQGKVNEIRLVPRNGYYIFEAVYEVESGIPIDNNRVAAIDLGLSNLATVSSNVKEFQPFIINGKPLKSINQYYNKKRGELQSKLQKQGVECFNSNKINKLTRKRNLKVETYLHQASRKIINNLRENKIGTLVIGNNQKWKQEINIGKRNNQNFVQIPHHKFIEQLTYKAELVGIKVIINEESYTSKASFLDLDNIPNYQKGVKHKFSGQRIKRGLYKSKNGLLINPDLNGSYNILRKAVPNAYADGIEGLGVVPFRVTPGKVSW